MPRGGREAVARAAPSLAAARPCARSRGALLAVLLAASSATACARPPADAPGPAAPGEWRTFEGTWSAAGDRRAIEVAPDRSAAILELSGSILLTGDRGIGEGFHGRVVAFSDGTASLVGRAVWIDERGDRIFSELHGAPVATGQRIAGTITGGTGRWAGVTGEYAFDWTWVVETEGRVQGRTVGLRGRARIPPAGGGR
jgi:hypothetical protein